MGVFKNEPCIVKKHVRFPEIWLIVFLFKGKELKGT